MFYYQLKMLTQLYKPLYKPMPKVLCFWQAHEFDECRFDVGVNDCLWYLRVSSSEERWNWMSTLEVHKVWDIFCHSHGFLKRSHYLFNLF